MLLMNSNNKDLTVKSFSSKHYSELLRKYSESLWIPGTAKNKKSEATMINEPSVIKNDNSGTAGYNIATIVAIDLIKVYPSMIQYSPIEKETTNTMTMS